MQRETRKATGIRLTSDGDGHRYLTVRAITPGVVDDYGSLWNPHTFDESAAKRMPTLTWGHDWAEPIGRGVNYEPSDDGPVITFRFDDPEAVPTARRAIAQVESGTIDDVSVGFSGTTRRAPTDEERQAYPGVLEVIEKANLDETALVLLGAVPGAKVLQLRSGEVPGEFVLDLARKIAAGDISHEEAEAALRLTAAAGDGDAPSATTDPEPEPVDLAEVDAVLESVLRWGR